MRSTPFTSCSMGVATDCSTASAEAPGYVPVTRMLGGARNGYCSTERPRVMTSPSMTVRMEMTMATIGRRMKKFATPRLPSLRPPGSFRLTLGHARRHLHLAPRPDLLHPLDDDALAGA